MWHVDGKRVNLQSERLHGALDLEQPQLGLRDVQIHAAGGPNEAPQVSLLQLALPKGTPQESIRDQWVRGSDLVVVYAATEQRASQPEIYWRVLTSEDAFGLELIVSVQTGLLDDQPAMRVVSHLLAREAWWMPAGTGPEAAQRISPITSGSDEPAYRAEGPGSCIIRWPSRFSYVEMVHPTDFCGCELGWDNREIALQTVLFPERLEKGVIRRGRIRGWFLPAAGDFTAAGRLWQEFVDSKLPLTT